MPCSNSISTNVLIEAGSFFFFFFFAKQVNFTVTKLCIKSRWYRLFILTDLGCIMMLSCWYHYATTYTARLLFHQSLMLHSDNTVTGQWQHSQRYQLLAAQWRHSNLINCVVTLLSAVNVTTPSLSSHHVVTVQHRWQMEWEFCCVLFVTITMQEMLSTAASIIIQIGLLLSNADSIFHYVAYCW